MGYPTLAQAQAACALDYQCGGVTSQDGGGPPWETRHGTRAIFSGQGETSYIINNSCHSSSALCHTLPPTFTISASGASNQILTDAMARYTTMVNTAYAPTATAPPGGTPIEKLNVVVASADEALKFGMDESYTLSVAAGAAVLSAPTVWGALRGLETFSQLARHTWTTNAVGAINASYNEVCEVMVTDAPRFPMRSLMIDTARHFMPLSVIKQVIELSSYLKLNSLRLHLIDTDSWSYYIPELPAVTNTSAYTPLHVYYPQDLAELVAFGRARGVIVWPEVDFPFHSASILSSIPELGCLSPDGKSRMFIDPTFPDLWPTMGKIFGSLNQIFPPEFPIHMGGDEVDRNAWATCPSVIAWAAAKGAQCSSNVANCVTHWWYSSLYNFLAAPPYNRVVFAWEDATDAVDASWVGAFTGGLVLKQWFGAPPPPLPSLLRPGEKNCARRPHSPPPSHFFVTTCRNGSPNEWRSGVCDIAHSSNASVLVAGPFMDVLTVPGKDYGAIPYNSHPDANYAELYNLTCNVTDRLQQQLVGPELMFWDDAGDISPSDLVLMLMSSVVPVAESGWSPSAVVQDMVNPTRYQDFRCRMARRGMQSHDAYGHVSTFCVSEYEEVLMPWSV